MSLENIQNYSQKEKDMFSSVCASLLGRTFVVRSVITEKGRIRNPEYDFLVKHYEDVRDYLGLMNWSLFRNDFLGFYYVTNDDEANRCNLNKTETAILLALRLIYEDDQERIGLDHDVVATVNDVLVKVVTDYGIISTKPNMDEIKRTMKKLDDHRVIQLIEGKYNQAGARFAILPTILNVVSSEKMNAVVSEMKKEDPGEEA